MRYLTSLVAITTLVLATSVFAGEFNNEDALALVNGKHVKTDCKINTVAKDGKTYCFSDAKAKKEFMKHEAANIERATKAFAKG